MVGSIISTYMMFLPETTKWFCLIGLFVFFFGIYVPYDKYKQKKKKSKKDSSQMQKPQKTVTRGADGNQRKQLEQLETLKKAGLLSEEEFREKKREMR